MRRPQKTRKLGYHQRASVEHEGYDEVRSTSQTVDKRRLELVI